MDDTSSGMCFSNNLSAMTGKFQAAVCADAKIFGHFLSSWMDRRLLKLNKDKCKVVSYGRNILINANYNLKQSILARELKKATMIWGLNLTPN